MGNCGRTSDAVLNQEMSLEAQGMLADGFIEGLARQLRNKFPTVADEADASVGHGIHKLITRSAEPADPRGYVAACAYNEMKRYGVRAARADSLDALREADDGKEPADDGWSVEEQALIDEVYRTVTDFVSTWETGNVRAVTLLFLEAAYYGEPLSSEEAASRLAEILAEEVDADFVRVWKSRGFKRLREWVKEQEMS